MVEPPEPSTAIGAAASVSHRLIKTLPPAFLLLVILNCAFLGVIAWLFNHAAEARFALLTQIVEHCLDDQKPAPH